MFYCKFVHMFVNVMGRHLLILQFFNYFQSIFLNSEVGILRQVLNVKGMLSAQRAL